MNLRNKIIEATIELCNRNGVSNITTNHIIDALNISPGTLYYHFKNKEEIVRAIFALIAEEYDAIYPDASGELRPEDFFTAVRNGFAVMYRYRFFYLELPMLLDRDPRLKRHYADNLRKKTARQEGLLATLVASGIVELPESSDEIQCILENIWIVNDFWLSFLVVSGRRITEKSVDEGMRHYYCMVKPYLSGTAREEFPAILEKLCAR